MAEGQTHVEKEWSGPLGGEREILRLLALEIRPSKAGFAIFEGSTLLDWGVTHYSRPVAVIRRIGSLLDLHGPSILITRRRPPFKNSQAGAQIVRTIKREAQGRSIWVRSVDAQQIRTFFRQRGCGNKHKTAVLLAEWFSELAWKVPPKRKPWQSEPHNALLFDAVAMAVTFLATRSSHEL